jgi:glucans biosynthesis protein
VWVEPLEEWGKGNVRLVELPSGDETNDNVVAFWEPATYPESGQSLRVKYRQHWSLDGNPAKAGAWVTSTRTGTKPWKLGYRLVVLDFMGPALDRLQADAKLELVVSPDDPAAAEVIEPTVYPKAENGHYRASFFIRQKPDAAGNPRPPGDVEVRGFLRNGQDVLTETWSYRVRP